MTRETLRAFASAEYERQSLRRKLEPSVTFAGMLETFLLPSECSSVPGSWVVTEGERRKLDVGSLFSRPSEHEFLESSAQIELQEEREKIERLLKGIERIIEAPNEPTAPYHVGQERVKAQLRELLDWDAEKDSERVLPAEYQPDVATPPGDTIQEMMDARGMTLGNLVERMGCFETHLSQVMQGTLPITNLIAYELSRVFDYPASFWLNLESNYRRTFARLAKESRVGRR